MMQSAAGISQENLKVISRYHKTEVEMLAEYEIILQAKTDPGKFSTLYDTYYEPIFRFVYQRMDDKEKAFDITSQVFLKALTNLHRYEFKGVPFASWLYRIARSEVYQQFRQNKASRTVNLESVHLNQLTEELEENNLEEYRVKMLKALKELEEEDITLVEMRFFEKRPFKEIGEILEITENNAKVKLYRVLDKLKRKLLKHKTVPDE